ncbi:MAG: hypothetical protein ACRDOB_24720 [Streptosporangiaceae bacterium]
MYWWGGLQAARGGPLYASGGPFSFTYPPFAASLFRLGAAAPEGWLAAVITAGSIVALVALCWQALGGVRGWWLTAALLTGLAGVAVAAWAHRRGHRLAGVVCCAVTGLLVSPFSWTHHWVWVVPLLIGLVTTAWRRRSGGWGLVAVVVAVAFSGLVPLPAPGRPPSPVLLAAGDLYVLCGLALLAGAALVLARESRPARPGPARPNLSGRPWRGWPSLIGWTMAWSPEVRLPSHQIGRQP